MDTKKWLDKARTKIEYLDTNRPFELKQLFEGTDWNTLTNGEKKSFGRLFSNEVHEGHFPNVKALERGKDNHSKYMKISELSEK